MQIKLVVLTILLYSKALGAFCVNGNFKTALAGNNLEEETTVCNSNSPSSNEMYLSEWDLGIALHSAKDTNAFIYFRFYEWHLFDAIESGEHTRGKD
jgi:hypothetical protein